MANRASEWAGRASGAFSGLRDRLSGRKDDGYDDGYDEYDDYGYTDDGYSNDYGEYGYDPEAEEDYETSSTGPVSTRAVGSSTGYSGSTGYSSNPRLVSMDEASSSVTARTGAVDPASRVPSYRQSSTTASYRAASTSSDSSRSRGYDSLFTSTSSTAGTGTTGSSASTTKTPVYQIPLTKAPDDRSLEIVRPKEYGDVADVAAILKKGDAVVLSLKMAPSAISTRVLDFAFGVASALDANVECVGEKVFFVVRGKGISDGEREKLRLQGVVQ